MSDRKALFDFLDAIGIPEKLDYYIKNCIRFEGESIVRLELRDKVNSIPEQISNLKNLEYLTFRKITLEEISSLLCEIVNLKELDLYGNAIEEIPPQIGLLQNLRYLNLGANHLTEIPDQIQGLKSLQQLLLRNNKIRTISQKIGDLRSLVRLELPFNQLNELPSDLGKLGALEELLVAHNNLTTLPPDIKQLERLTRLDFCGNSTPKDWGCFYDCNEEIRKFYQQKIT